MPIRIRISLDEKTAQGKIDGLTRVETSAVLQKLSLASEQRSALRYLKSVFPQSSKGSKSDSSAREFGMRLVEGWRVNPVLKATTVGFTIDHVLSRNSRASRVLDILDQGRRPYTYIATSLHHFVNSFKGRGRRWVTLTPEKPIHFKGQQGSDYRQKTYDYIQDVLMPQIGVKLEKLVRKEIDNAD